MGNGGGDSKSACENTFEATEAGLKAGMNAVRIDVSMSAEGTLFLWRDHLPGDNTMKFFAETCWAKKLFFSFSFLYKLLYA